MDPEKSDELAAIMQCSVLKHVYTNMKDRGWQNRTQASSDGYISEKLDAAGCYTLEDVRKKHNSIAARHGLELL